MTCCLRHWTHLFDFPLCRFLGIKHLESRFRIPFWKEYFIACHDTEVLPPGKIGHAILYEEIIGIGLSLRESQSGPCAYLLVRWGYFSHRPWWNTLRNTGTRAVILSSLALFAPEHRTSPRGIFDTPIDLDGDAAKRGRLQVWILLACLPECACFPSRYGLYAGSIRCSACCGFRPAQAICCASESLCMGLTPFFRLHDQAQVPHPVRFFSEIGRAHV